MKTKIYSLVAGLLLTASVWAQAPQKMSYQAVIRNSSNALVTSTSVGMQISILQGTPTGTVAYSETQTLSTNANGLVSLEIGTGTPVTGTFASINWATGPYFIKTETDPTGGTNYTIAGTNELMSVPYALFSANGTPGATGAQGPIGLTGAQGIAGNNGTDGTNGTNGTNGLSAYDVWIGLGNVGTQTDFINSLTGPQGQQGIQGLTGATGPQGPIGLTGATGSVGATGAIGSQGPIGLTGAAGAAGSDGIAGIEGGGLLTVSSSGFNYFVDGVANSFPTLTLVRGQLYYFNVSAVASSHPFALRLSNGNTAAVPGTTNNNTTTGQHSTNTLTLYRVPLDAPSSIVYQCVFHSGMIGTINIVDQNGIAGATGSQGPIGLTGATGSVGATGATGPQGPIGLTGATGSVGATGAQGNQGIQGLTGAAGAQGPIGLTGAAGNQGPIGLTGATGSVGATGAQGIQGIQGLTGAAGAQGIQGLTGATGPQGSIGLTGATGSVGATGAQGNQGIQGLTGAAGPQGPIGVTGATGSVGATGAQGLTGATGPQGPIGLTGATGSVGATGAAGTNGTNGAVGGFTHYLGEAFNGGIIYYLYKGSDGLEHGLIVALTESIAAWSTTALPVQVNANRTEDGAYNTNLMTGSPAKTYIASLGAGWYLPSIDELGLLYHNRYSAQKGLRAGGNTLLQSTGNVVPPCYWSSSESYANFAWSFNFDFGGANLTSDKNDTNYVRAVRAF
jgi:hypothetical protein